MSNLATITHTHLYAVVMPPAGYKDDADFQLRTLAHKEEALARQARDQRRNLDAQTHADRAIRYHLEAEARYVPTAQPQRIPSPLPIGEQIGIVFFVFIAACGLFGWLAGVL